jgi:hypothetical protein
MRTAMIVVFFIAQFVKQKSIIRVESRTMLFTSMF